MIFTKIDTVGQFRDQFHSMGRGEQFSYEGLSALFEFLESLGLDYELDVIALCCEFTESSIEDALNNYALNSLEELEEKTIVMRVNDDTIIYQNF